MYVCMYVYKMELWKSHFFVVCYVCMYVCMYESSTSDLSNQRGVVYKPILRCVCLGLERSEESLLGTYVYVCMYECM
jgi:hypothetical protein